VIYDSAGWLLPGVDQLVWRKSTFSTSGECVEIAGIADTIALRNSNNPERAMLPFERTEVGRWIAAIKAGEFDDLAS
jgi:hypothetical protein